jgi:hypothetical protein
MATQIQLQSTNYNGQIADITFYPCSGGTISLGNQTIPYTYTNDNYEGTYDLYFSAFNQTCQLVIICPSPTPTPTLTPTTTQGITPTPTPSVTATLSPTPTNTGTPTNTPSATPTITPTNTSTPTNTPSVSPSATPTITPTNTGTPTNTPTSTLTPTPTPSGAVVGGHKLQAENADFLQTESGEDINIEN